MSLIKKHKEEVKGGDEEYVTKEKDAQKKIKTQVIKTFYSSSELLEQGYSKCQLLNA